MIAQLTLSPVTSVTIGLMLAWFDLISSEPFDQLTYALSYASGHVEQSLWTSAQAAEFMQRAWLNALPELLWRTIGYVGLIIGVLCAQRYWRLFRSAKSTRQL